MWGVGCGGTGVGADPPEPSGAACLGRSSRLSHTMPKSKGRHWSARVNGLRAGEGRQRLKVSVPGVWVAWTAGRQAQRLVNLVGATATAQSLSCERVGGDADERQQQQGPWENLTAGHGLGGVRLYTTSVSTTSVPTSSVSTSAHPAPAAGAGDEGAGWRVRMEASGQRMVTNRATGQQGATAQSRFSGALNAPGPPVQRGQHCGEQPHALGGPWQPFAATRLAAARYAGSAVIAVGASRRGRIGTALMAAGRVP